MMAHEDVVEVRALPDQVVDHAASPSRRSEPANNGSNGALSLTQRMGRDRHDRHLAAVNKLHADLAAVREEVDTNIMEHSQRARQKIMEGDEEARELLAQLQDDDALRQMSWQQVVMCRTMILEQLQGCISIIDTLYDTLMEIETQRVEKLRHVLRNAHRLIVSIAHVLPHEADHLVFTEAENINRAMLDNYTAYAEIRAKLLADRVHREEQMDIQWEILSERWKHFKEQDLTQHCLDTILDLTDYDRQRCERLDQFHRDMRDLMRTRIELMKSAAQLSPAHSSASEYPARLQAWQMDMQRVHDMYAEMHHKLRDDLHQLLEQKQNQCNAAVTECLTSLVEDSVCSPERARMLVDRECRHACVTALRDSHRETEAFIKALDDVSATLHSEAEALSDICRSLHDQWSDCRTAVAQQEDTVVDKIQQLRAVLRERQEETEHELDLKIDALRQAGSKDALSSCKRVVEQHLVQAKRLLEEYGEGARAVPDNHSAKVKTQAQTYFERIQAILGVVRLSGQSAERAFDERHIVQADGRSYRMKKRRWAPTRIGVRNHGPVSLTASRPSSRASSREGRAGEKSAVYLRTAPRPRRVISRMREAESVPEEEAEDDASEALPRQRRGGGGGGGGGSSSGGRMSVDSVRIAGEIGDLSITIRPRTQVEAPSMGSSRVSSAGRGREHQQQMEQGQRGRRSVNPRATLEGGVHSRSPVAEEAEAVGSGTQSAVRGSRVSGTGMPISPGTDDGRLDGEDELSVDDAVEQQAQDVDPLARPFERPRIAPVRLASDAAARRVVRDVPLTEDNALQIWAHICADWLKHADAYQTGSVDQAEEFSSSRKREVEAEVDAALEMHDGRIKRIEEDVHNVRAAELVMHQHRVYRHSEAIEYELKQEKDRAGRLQEQLHQEASQFERAIDLACGELCSKRSRKELDMHKAEIEEQYRGYRKVIREALIQYRKALDAFLRRLKESNASFRASFRSFTENGNFSSDEIVQYKQVISHVFSRIDRVEGEILTELEGLESSFMTAANRHMERFQQDYTIHHRDVSLLEETRQLISTCKVKIQSEINRCDSAFKQLETTYAQLDRIKHDVTGEADRIFSLMKALSDGVIEQAGYLNCIKHGAPHSYHGDKGDKSGRASRVSVASRSAASTRSTKTQGGKRRGQTAKQQPVGRNTVPVAVRGLRLMVEDWNPGRSDTFMHTITSHRIDCRTAVIHLAVPFYEKGHARHTLRPLEIRETIQMYMDHVQDVLLELQQRARAYYEQAVWQLIDLLARINTMFIESTKAVFENITFKCVSQHKTAMQELHGAALAAKRKAWAQQHKQHMAQLRPQLAHPAKAAELEAVDQSEQERMQGVQATLKEIQEKSVEADDEALVTYVKEMNEMVHNLCRIFEDVLNPNELYLPSPDPEAPPEIAEQRQKGRFPLIVTGQVMPGHHRRLTSAHGVGMLSTSLHHRAIEARDKCVRVARQHFADADKARKDTWKDAKVALELEKTTWEETIGRIRSLVHED